jgi:hypothetical protein
VNVVLLSVPGTLLPRTTTPFSRPSSRQPAFGPMQGDPRTRSDSPHVACQFLALPCTMLRCLLHQPRRPPSCSCPGRTYRDQCHSLGIVVRSCERTPSYQLAAAAVPARSCGASTCLGMALSSAQRALRVAPANKRGTPARLQRMQRGALRVAAASATVRLILDCAWRRPLATVTTQLTAGSRVCGPVLSPTPCSFSHVGGSMVAVRQAQHSGLERWQ